jgi:tetratricopeptide (TPR) repeat protein
MTLIKLSLAQNFYDQGYNEYKTGNDNRAIELLTKAIENNQNTAQAYMYRGVSKTYLRKYSEATLDFQASIKHDSTNYKIYYYYGRMYSDQGFFKTAIKYYDKSIFKNSSDADVFDDRAMAKCKNDDYEGALKDANMAIKLNPDKSDYYITRGMVKVALKNYKDAINDFDQTIKLKGDPQAYVNKAAALSELGLYEEAIKYYTIGLKELPKSIEIYYFRGLSYKAIGKHDLACEDFSKGASMDHKFAKIEYEKTCLK